MGTNQVPIDNGAISDLQSFEAPRLVLFTWFANKIMHPVCSQSYC